MAFDDIDIYENYMQDIGTPVDPLMILELHELREEAIETGELEKWTGLAGRAA